MALFLNRRKEEKKLGLYIHIPFCKSRCAYCSFYSNGGKMDPKLVDHYMQALADHMGETGKGTQDYVVDTIYFGGGTPSYFGAENLDNILDEIHRYFHVSIDPEITVEANPDSLDEKTLKRLLKAGFNRLSIGVQSHNDEVLQQLGRPHTFEQAKEAMELARKVGFANISMDLMYGLPGQDMEMWMESVEKVVAMRPEHISCYCLTIDEDCPMYSYRNSLKIADDDYQLRMYLMASQYLREHGYEHYEISNFAKKGLESRHNMKYWLGEEYIGFGPSAASDFGGKRFKILDDTRGYIEGIQKQGQILSECETVPPRERSGEFLMLRARLKQGFSPKEYETKFLRSFEPMGKFLERCAQEGYAEYSDGRWSLTEKGWFISNTIIVRLQEAQKQSRHLPGKI